MGMRTSLLVLCASSCPALAGAQSPPLCTASIEHHDTPSWRGMELVIGEAGSGYDESALLVPEPVLLGIRARNEDTLRLRCLRDCQKRTIPSTWTAGWAIVSDSAAAGASSAGTGIPSRAC